MLAEVIDHHAGRIAYSGSVSPSAAVAVLLQRLPEGVWLGRSEDVPGLTIQADTREEAMALAPHLIRDLIELNELPFDADHLKIAFVFPSA